MTHATIRVAFAILCFCLAPAAWPQADAVGEPDIHSSTIESAEPWVEALRRQSTALTDPTHADADWHIPVAGLTVDAPDARPQPTALLVALDSHLAMKQAGGWPALPESGELHAGGRDAAVAVLRKRLRASGDYSGHISADPWYFEPALDAALRRFQARHGLTPTGVLDTPTRAAANVALDERIAQIALTLERWRWLPRDPGSRHVWVNIGNGSLEVIDGGRSVLTMRVIVGHPQRATPSMTGELQQVVFNPSWSVPRRIAVEDLLPRQIENPTFLAERGFRVLQITRSGEREIDPARVAWDELNADRFPYQLRQRPGPDNSLGRIKIGWNNSFDIYLHDTPARGLFSLGRRTLSSGCVRLENAAGLATFLLAQDRAWDEAATVAQLEAARTEVINLRHRVPLYIVYLTTWVTEDGVHFGRDLYGRDARMLIALRTAATPGAMAKLP
jgi:L,D-transpeptidase YcbB